MLITLVHCPLPRPTTRTPDKDCVNLAFDADKQLGEEREESMGQGKYLQIETLSTYQASIVPVLVELHAMYLSMQRTVPTYRGPAL